MTHRISSLLALLLLLVPQVGLARPRAVRGNPIEALPKGNMGRLVFGVMGSAAPESTIPPEVRGRLERLGLAIARRGDVVLTGACPGMPQVTARAAKGGGGLTVGISPARSLRDHVQRFKSPTEALDVIKMTGAGGGMGLIARERDNIAHSDILVFAGGRSGTLGELLFAMQERKVIALLEDSTGVTAQARREILPYIGRGKGLIVTDRDPDRLIAKAVRASERLKARESRREGSRSGTLQSLARPLGLPVQRTGLEVDALRKSHNLYTFFGDARRMSERDRAKVERMVDELARTRTDGREPLLVLPTRPGLGSKVARSAHARGVKTFGISPAGSAEEHRRAGQFVRGLDRLQLSGEGAEGIGKLAAYQHAIKKSDVVFVAGGDHETLGGTIFALYEPTVVAVLETGGMSGKLRRHILATYEKAHPAKVIFDRDPVRLVQRATAEAQALRQAERTEYIRAE
jgi:predicted Rossmann-fold nucleotide-binding protein